MPRASQDYSDQDYQFIKRAAALKDQDIRQWISTTVVQVAKQQLVDDARSLIQTLDTPEKDEG